MHTLYLGPSWAVQSYESNNGDDDPVKTNLALELGLTNYTQLANYNNTNMAQLSKAITFMDQHPNLAPFCLVFVLSSSLDDAPMFYNMSRENFAHKFLSSVDPISFIKNAEKLFYQEINKLNISIALIGAHTDVVDFDFKENITVIHPSWQNFLGSQCGLNKFFGWPAEIANLWLQGRLEYDVYIDIINPSTEVVLEIDKLFSHWTTMQTNKLWNGVHPSILGNQLFAKEIADTFNKWVDNVV
jgi:hypothetical protein